MNRVYQLEYNGGVVRLSASSHTPEGGDTSIMLRTNENYDIQGLGRIAKLLNARGEEIVSLMRAGFGPTKADRRYVIITRVVAREVDDGWPKDAFDCVGG